MLTRADTSFVTKSIFVWSPSADDVVVDRNRPRPIINGGVRVHVRGESYIHAQCFGSEIFHKHNINLLVVLYVQCWPENVRVFYN